jgi:hypothetical protein
VREILNYVPRRRRTSLVPPLDLAMRRIPHRALVFLISDFILPPSKENDWGKALRATAKKHDVVAIHITDPRELELPRAGRVTLEDPETRQQITVNTSDPDVRRLYARRVRQSHEELNQFLRKSNVERITVSTAGDYLPALRAYFRSRKRH